VIIYRVFFFQTRVLLWGACMLVDLMKLIDIWALVIPNRIHLEHIFNYFQQIQTISLKIEVGCSRQCMIGSVWYWDYLFSVAEIE